MTIINFRRKTKIQLFVINWRLDAKNQGAVYRKIEAIYLAGKEWIYRKSILQLNVQPDIVRLVNQRHL